MIQYIFVAIVMSLVLGTDSNEILAKDLNFQLPSGDLIPLVGIGTYKIKGKELIRDVLDHALAAGYRLIDSAKLYENEEAIGQALKELLPKYNLTRQDIWITTKLLGTAHVRGQELVKNVLDAALASGYRLIDTAKLYYNEEEIGKALKELLPKYNLTRRDIWITTKLAPEDQGEKAYAALQESLKRLGVDYVDLYLIHWPGAFRRGNDTGNDAGNVTDAELRDKSWQQLVKAVRAGLTKNIGISNYLVRHMKQLVENDHGIKPAVNQIEWNPYYHPEDILDYARKEGILLQAYTSLGGQRGPDLRADPTIKGIANRLGKTFAQVLLRWALQRNIAVVPRSGNKKHIEDNIELNFIIPEEDMNTLSNYNITKKYSWNPKDVL